MKFFDLFSEMFSDEFTLENDYIKNNIPISIKHKCGYKFEILPSSILRNKSCVCPKCNPSAIKKVIKGVNDIATTNPELISLFKDSSDAEKYKKYSKKYAWFNCPDCGHEYYLQIQNVTKLGRVTCPFCSDGFSYPEKFMSNILKQLNINFKWQFTDYWTDNFRYDFMFEYDNKKYIIETDGGLGHGNRTIDEKSILESIEIDKRKDELATKNGFILIRVDCNYSNDRFEYIKNSIINSIGNLFDLSNIDWNKSNIEASNSYVKAVINCYKNTTKDTFEISNIIGIAQRTVTKYLHDAMKVGLLPNETVYKNHYKSRRKTGGAIGKKVYCYEDALIFDSIKAAEKHYGLTKGCITQAIKNHGSCKQKHFELYDNLPKDFNFKKTTIKKQYPYKRTPIIHQYTLNHELINTYYGMHDLEESTGYNRTNVYRVHNGERKTAYGFYWSLEEGE